MKRILRFDILFMSLFLMFGGNLASAQKNTIFGTPARNPCFNCPFSDEDESKKEDAKRPCISQNSDGEFCFVYPVVFASLDFPCDLYAGIQIGDSDIRYVSLTDGVDYQFNDHTKIYTANLNFGCLNSNEIYAMIQGTNEALLQTYCASNTGDPIASIDLSIDIYCKTDQDMIAVDFCTQKEVFSEIIATNVQIDNDGDYTNDIPCSLGFTTMLEICCIEFPEVLTPLINNDTESNTINVSYQETNFRFDEIQSNKVMYEIYDMNGYKLQSGELENINSAQGTINDVNLNNGVYILVLVGEQFHSSHKFVSFK